MGPQGFRILDFGSCARLVGKSEVLLGVVDANTVDMSTMIVGAQPDFLTLIFWLDSCSNFRDELPIVFLVGAT